MGTVLIAYATRTSAAADIADAVAEVLRSAGHEVRVADVRTDPGVDGADLVVFGSGINASAYYPEATAWLKAKATDLVSTRLAVYNTCLNAADPAKQDLALSYNDAVVTRHGALSSAAFAGRYVPAEVGWASKLLALVTRRRAQDHLDADAARAWAEALLPLADPETPPHR